MVLTESYLLAHMPDIITLMLSNCFLSQVILMCYDAVDITSSKFG